MNTINKSARWVNAEYRRKRMANNTDESLLETLIEERLNMDGYFGDTRESARKNLRKRALELRSEGKAKKK